ncbi:hypothetical protein C8R46DRAFT_1231086 [Mycena filopes]|nr:hypothetical protein C8R46DRAFT_1231086 [Mycena filopes]
MPFPCLRVRSLEYYDFQNECDRITYTWKTRDRSAVRSYPQHVAARDFMRAKLAASAAIAHRRAALDAPYQFRNWLRRQGDPGPSVEEILAEFYPPPWGTAAPEFQRFLANGEPATPDNWGLGTAWGSSWGSSWGKDPAWDGVTPTPKTPGKRRRQRARKRRAKQETDAAHAAFKAGTEEAMRAFFGTIDGS